MTEHPVLDVVCHVLHSANATFHPIERPESDEFPLVYLLGLNFFATTVVYIQFSLVTMFATSFAVGREPRGMYWWGKMLQVCSCVGMIQYYFIHMTYELPVYLGLFVAFLLAQPFLFGATLEESSRLKVQIDFSGNELLLQLANSLLFTIAIHLPFSSHPLECNELFLMVLFIRYFLTVVVVFMGITFWKTVKAIEKANRFLIKEKRKHLGWYFRTMDGGWKTVMECEEKKPLKDAIVNV